MIADHPEREQIRLEHVLSALGNPLRLSVVRMLAQGEERTCGSFLRDQTKSTMTHHWRVLRTSGVIWQRPVGRENLLSLRREDLDARFPGLLDALLCAMEADAQAQAGTVWPAAAPGTAEEGAGLPIRTGTAAVEAPLDVCD